jgi:predicted DNA binding protein
MRELVFTLDYKPGCNAIADTLAEYPAARIRSLSLHATEESLWRVDHATGSGDALDALEDSFLTADYYADCLATEECGATQTTEVLQDTEETLVLYSYWERTPTCESIPHMALDHLGEGALFETRHEEHKYTWRIIHSESGDVRTFFDDIEATVEEYAEIDIERLTEMQSPPGTNSEAEDLPQEQADALRAAVDHGYYETPRELDVGELADKLDVPRSTLTYRLRRAEAAMAKQRVEEMPSDEELSPFS